MTPNHIINVNDKNFQYEVINFSQNTPVIVEFWAAWSRECRTASPILEKLTRESSGSFRLAKIDVDASPNLALMYNVRSVPAIKAISHGRVIREYFGITPENKLQELIDQLLKDNNENLTLEKAENLLLDRQWEFAQQTYSEFLKNNPNQSKALLGLCKTFIALNDSESALEQLKNFPTTPDSQQADLLFPLTEELGKFKSGMLPAEERLDRNFKTAIRLFYVGNFPAALDGLLSIIKLDQNYRNGLARKVFLGITELLGSQTPEMRTYQQELTSILF